MLKVIAALVALQQIEPAVAAKALGARPGTTTDVTPYRHETPLALDGVQTATVVVGGEKNDWRIVEVVSDPKNRVKLAELASALSGLPHAVQPREGHGLPGTSHLFRTPHLELVVDVDGDDRVERVILTTEVTVPRKAPPLFTK
jgi:hypothetical protein